MKKGKTLNGTSVCGMCTVRCPIQVESEDGVCRFIQGNPRAADLEGGLCARGSGGIAVIEDNQRPRKPLIRTGARGEGLWRTARCDEALDYVLERLKKVSARKTPQCNQ